jgi:hypothetical protein
VLARLLTASGGKSSSPAPELAAAARAYATQHPKVSRWLRAQLDSLPR